MRRNTISRRQFAIGGTAAAAGLLAGTRTARAEDVNLRMLWWGSQERIRRTTADLDLYHQNNPGVTLTGESAGSDYWAKVATQMAGRNLADIFQLDHGSIADYSHRGAARPLDAYMPKPLDIAAFGKDMLALGQIGGTTYGVAQGVNTYAIVYDSTVLDAVKVKPPTYGSTWAELGALALEITKSVGKPNYFGLSDGSGHYYALDPWLVQRGRSIYKDDGSGVNFSVDDATAWFDYWAGLRKSGACTSADISAVDDGQIPNTPLARNNAALDIEFSNYIIGYQAMTKNRLALAALPNGDPGAKPGLYPRPALIWSVASNCRHPEAAAAFIHWWVTSPESAKIIGVERGVPVLDSMRAVIKPNMTETEQMTIDYLDGLKDKMAPFRYWPIGGSEFDRTVLRPTAQLVAFGKLSPAEGARKLINDSKSIF